MPGPFQPRFVDLVRNLSITTGTGNFVLGAAVSGFTSFSPAILPGESFYYSAIGVDKPAEREVGRGTMQSNGTIARDSISGTLTNFTPGAKSIALIAAAEWFNSVQASSESSSGSGATTRAALAALTSQLLPVVLSEAGREGIFVFDATNLSAKISADTAQGLFVAPLSDPSGATGAWVRRFSGPVNVKWFGATGDGVTNDGPAFTAAIALLKVIAGNPTNTFYKASPELFIPASHYYLGTTTLDITHTLTVRGAGGLGFGNAGQGGAATRLRWAANTTGIRIQSYITSGASTVDGASHFSGAFTQIKDLHLAGGRTTEASTPEGEYHGIHTKAQVYLEGLLVENFQGDGLHAHNSTPNENSNCSRATNCSFNNNRNGRSMQGGDANAWLFVGCQYNYNRAWGVKDVSFLGNSEIGAHAADNGLQADQPSATIVSNGTNRYYVIDGQAAGASTNAPPAGATDNTYWGYAYAGAASAPIIPTWTNGITVREGGAYNTNNLNANNVFSGCYSEAGQGPSQFTYPTVVLGGTMASGVKGYVAWVRNWQGYVQLNRTRIEGNLVARADAYVGRDDPTDPVSDTGFYLRNTNAYSQFSFESFNGGYLLDGYLLSWRGNGLFVSGQPNIWLRSGSTTIAHVGATGFDVTGTIAATGAITGSNLSGTHSGTNTGDQTITLTGNVTGSGTGSFAATIANSAVTLAKMADVATATVFYRKTAAAGAPEVQTLATLKTDLGLTGTNSGDQTITLTGNVTGSGTGSFATTIAAGAVMLAMQANMATASLVYRKTAGSGAPEIQTLATLKTDLGLTGTNSGDQTITLTGDVTGSGAGSFAATIGAATVTYAKIQNVSATSKLLGRASAGAGVVEELGLAGGLTISGANLTLGALTPTSVAATGAMTTSSPSAGNGYATGAGGAATQATSKSTAVTLNNVCGAITMNAAALATVTNVTFTLTNSAITATDVVVVAIKSGSATAGTYQAWVSGTAAGSCTITVRNISAGSLSEALVLNFAVNKAVAA